MTLTQDTNSCQKVSAVVYRDGVAIDSGSYGLPSLTPAAPIPVLIRSNEIEVEVPK